MNIPFAEKRLAWKPPPDTCSRLKDLTQAARITKSDGRHIGGKAAIPQDAASVEEAAEQGTVLAAAPAMRPVPAVAIAVRCIGFRA